MSESKTESTEAAPAVRLVRSLLERHAVPRHRHASYVGEFFRLSRAAAHQRVTRSSAWTLEEVQALAQHFGESLSDVVRSPSASPDSHAARMRVGALQLDCEVWLGADAAADCTDALVAGREVDGPWTVVPSTTAALWQIVRRITRLEIRPATTGLLRVAVVDADHAAAATVCAQLAASGVKSLAYPSVKDLLKSGRAGRHRRLGGRLANRSAGGWPRSSAQLAFRTSTKRDDPVVRWHPDRAVRPFGDRGCCCQPARPGPREAAPDALPPGGAIQRRWIPSLGPGSSRAYRLKEAPSPLRASRCPLVQMGGICRGRAGVDVSSETNQSSLRSTEHGARSTEHGARSTEGAWVVSVSSRGHRIGGVDFEDPHSIINRPF
jgi:hypothetical protein